MSLHTNNVTEGKKAGIIAYFSIIGTLIAFYMNAELKNPFANFHIRQALGTHIVFYLLGTLASAFDFWGVSIGFYIFIFLLWSFGLITAIQGDVKPIPLLGNYFQKWFTFIKEAS